MLEDLTLEGLDSFINIFIALCSWQLPNYYNLNKWRYSMLIIRCIYALSQVLLFFFLFLINRKLENKDERKVTVKPEASLFSSQPSQEEEMTYSEYDTNAFKTLLRMSLFHLVIVISMQLKWKSPTQLIVYSISVVKHFFLNPLFIAHIRNKEVLRPYSLNKLFPAKENEKVEAEKSKRED